MLFFTCELRKFFFFFIWWIIIVQIFSLLDLISKDYLFTGHIVSSLHMLKERIFFFKWLLNFFKVRFVCFYFSPPPKFPPKLFFPKTCFVFPIFIGGVVSILYRVGFICYLDSLFSLDICCVCFLFTLYLSCFY